MRTKLKMVWYILRGYSVAYRVTVIDGCLIVDKSDPPLLATECYFSNTEVFMEGEG